ncbi:hypothetical protein [Oleiharenicola sp. Vm1]|uniref:hypothetical protein n=1 Tax=Oleiharenicola sp. Vm1 TaxID=3398393 RepID=UPI0039F5B734
MKSHLPRLLLAFVSLGMLACITGCASLAEGLSQAAAELQRQQQPDPYGDPCYRAPANASAPGVR